MPPRQRALTIVLSFPAPRTNWSCAAHMAFRADRPPAARARGNRAEYDDLRALPARSAQLSDAPNRSGAGICVPSPIRPPMAGVLTSDHGVWAAAPQMTGPARGGAG